MLTKVMAVMLTKVMAVMLTKVMVFLLTHVIIDALFNRVRVNCYPNLNPILTLIVKHYLRVSL